MRIFPVAAAALVAFVGLSPALATEMVKKPNKAAPAAQVSRIDDIYAGNSRNQLITGAAVDPGSDNRYFTDTRNPHYLVGPGWFQRLD